MAVTALGACSSSSSSGSGGAASSPPAGSSSASSSVSAAADTGTVPANIAQLWSSGSGECGDESNFVAYVCGKPGAADPSLSPVEIGWANDQGGSIVSEGPEATDAAQLAVDWINKYAGGIDGHPLKLVTCFIQNSESEGKGCANKFLADPNIHVISYGATATGAQTINAGIAGKIPIIEGFALNPSDVTNPNTYVLYTASPFDYYAWGTFAQEVLHAKSMAIVYPQGTGFQNSAQAAVVSAQSLGISVKSVGYDPSSTSLTGALVELDEATLVARARDRDAGSFELLVRRYQRRIYTLCLRMLDGASGEAEDITQETFVTAWRRLPEIQNDAAFGGLFNSC